MFETMKDRAAHAIVKLSPSEQAVWDEEKTYWSSLKADDHETYLNLWDERFVGWPIVEKSPIHKSNIRQAFDKPRASIFARKLLNYTLEPMSVREYGPNIVIALYRTIAQSADEHGHDEQTIRWRITHTWMNTADGWRIIGGMSARDEPQEQAEQTKK